MKKSDVVFCGIPGYTGKITFRFLNYITKKQYYSVNFIWRRSITGLAKYIERESKNRKHIFIFPIYNEDASVADRRKKRDKSKNKNQAASFEFVENIETLCKKYQNCKVFHGSEIGKILGNKIKTNNLYSSHEIRCPKMVTNIEESSKIFVNEIENSHTETSGLLKSGEHLNSEMYNTEFIDTSFEYKNKKYYTCIRAMCIGNEISEVYLRFRDAEENNPTVHSGDTPLDADLNNFYYETKIMPNYLKLKKLCFDAGNLLGMGFYSHDILLCNKTDEFYIAETGFKFIDPTWRGITKNVYVYFRNEKNIEDSLKNIRRILRNQIKLISENNNLNQ